MRFSFNKFVLFAIFCIFNLVTEAQTITPEKPRLVVGIMVDGLQQRHLEQLWNYFDTNGFKRLVGKGINFKNLNYNIVSAGNTADIATIMTGTVPYYHGIVGNYFYNKNSGEIESIIQDNQEIGIGTKLQYSAHNMLSSSILDELVMESHRNSKTYAIGINAEETIMLGGHSAQSVAWIDDVFMKWITTGYYQDGLHSKADEMNVNGEFKNLVDRNWQPMFSTNTYLSAQGKNSSKKAFEYKPTDRQTKNSSVSILKNTPSANSLVAELGLKVLQQENLGMDNYTDMLLLQFTVRVPNEKYFSLKTIEKEDIYYRLDKEIQYLLQKIDNQVGMDRTLVFMFGNQTEVHTPSELGENKIPSGYFNASRSMALVNTYLMALYGQEKWIEGYYGKNIFLNKRKIEEKKLDLNQIQTALANFMLEFEGIQSAFTSTQLNGISGNSSSEIARLRNSTSKNSMGDVVFTLLPGWLEVDDKMNPVGESNAIMANTAFYLYGSKLPTKTIINAYNITDIAPTLSRLLNIPFPNACIGKPIKEVFE